MINVIDQVVTDRYHLVNGDSCEVLPGIPSDSIGYEIYSPPFSQLYSYSNSERDLGNCRNHEEFFEHFKFIARELYRVLKPGRLMSVHTMDIPAMKERDGYIGVIDFPGQLIRLFQEIGFIYHSRVTIWKDPLIEATRTKALGLMHKQIQKDSAMCRQGLPDYLITMRKPGDNAEPIAHPDGFTEFIGDNPPETHGILSHHVWRRYASPVWDDIRQTRTLNATGARDEKDERHIAPLQLDTVERGIELWSLPGDVVLTPFMGIGTEAFVAIKKLRFAFGIELKGSYYNLAKLNCEQAAQDDEQLTL